MGALGALHRCPLAPNADAATTCHRASAPSALASPQARAQVCHTPSTAAGGHVCMPECFGRRTAKAHRVTRSNTVRMMLTPTRASFSRICIVSIDNPSIVTPEAQSVRYPRQQCSITAMAGNSGRDTGKHLAARCYSTEGRSAHVLWGQMPRRNLLHILLRPQQHVAERRIKSCLAPCSTGTSAAVSTPCAGLLDSVRQRVAHT